MSAASHARPLTSPPGGGRVEVRAGADRLVADMGEAFAEGVASAPGRVAIALAGGSTPRRLYGHLARPPLRDRIDWRRVELFFGDERAVPESHADSNFAMARAALLDPVGATAHAMPALAGDAAGYERLVRERVPAGPAGLPAFDLVLLGVGADGHTASLFPGTAALAERVRLVVMNDGPGNGRRMTFTLPLLNAARRVWILATGEGKREIVRECFAGGRYPVTEIAPRRGELVWWLDGAAAAGLEAEAEAATPARAARGSTA